MPSRKLTTHCTQCSCKNHLRAAYCNQCGTRLKQDVTSRDQDGRAKLYADIAHPINSECREMIQERVIAEYQKELSRSQEPGYESRYDEAYDGEPPGPHAPHKASQPSSKPPSSKTQSTGPSAKDRPEKRIRRGHFLGPTATHGSVFSVG